MISVIKKQIDKTIKKLHSDENSVLVLKGIPLELYCEENIDLDAIACNKMGFLISSYGKRKFFSYEEFLLLKELMIAQYKTIYIINNNIYMNMYPVNLKCSQDTIDGLITHFAETEDDSMDEEYVGDVSEIMNIFIGLKKYNDYYIGSYNDSSIHDSDKLVVMNIFDSAAVAEICSDEYENNKGVIKITCEEDYIDFLRFLFETPSEVYINIDDYFDDGIKLKTRLSIIKNYWDEYTDLYVVKNRNQTEYLEPNVQVGNILSKYWGYSSFHDIPFYDLSKLDDGIKAVVPISQERIISDLISQVEKCLNNDSSAHDVFVTAPTGAGKSIMFQIPAIYSAEKHNLVTIVISPLIGLMNDQVKNLEMKSYSAAKTINSDISPVVKQEIMESVQAGQTHILYISPETLLSRSDVEQLIGSRSIGMIVIDEAHIVTTWGKQFRPDYWYLGDHIRKLRKRQIDRKGHSFVIATFTATAIYKGIEDMYRETINSLNMIAPSTYLGYVKRNDITIDIERKVIQKGSRSEYELDKIDDIKTLINRAVIMNKKTLIYFPTVALIDRCYEALRVQNLTGAVARFYAPLDKDLKNESFEKFKKGEKLVMLATKAFGMGIDIDNIEIVAHFAPTGNVCDYVQEIGRAARRKDLCGEACYKYDTRDFKHINRLHGLNMIKEYQLIEVIKKIVELYNSNNRQQYKNDYTRKKNAMLIDAENFSYIFDYSDKSREDDNINKVKTALLIIQKDFENSFGFSPVNIRPIPLFAIGYFEVIPSVQIRMNQAYPNSVSIVCKEKNICRINLESIWKKSSESHSFPQFKYLLYTKSSELEFNNKYPMTPALCIDVVFNEDHNSVFNKIWKPVKDYINKLVIKGEYISVDDLVDYLVNTKILSRYKAMAVCDVILASINIYKREYYTKTSTILKTNTSNTGKIKYMFNPAIGEYFSWVERKYKYIVANAEFDSLYVVNGSGTECKQINTVLGILESMNVLSFKMIGGANSQLYVYINQIQSMRNIIDRPSIYKNRLLDTVNIRHLISVKMLTYIYENDFSSDEIWDLLEDYFLGMIPESVKTACKKENPEITFE